MINKIENSVVYHILSSIETFGILTKMHLNEPEDIFGYNVDKLEDLLFDYMGILNDKLVRDKAILTVGDFIDGKTTMEECYNALQFLKLEE